MKKIAVIPARWKSKRLKGKILADINGKPMLRHVWESVSCAHEVDDVVIAVDSERVKKVAESFGAKVILTSPDQPSGTDRIAEVASVMEADIYINVQADEPMVHPMMVNELASVYDYDRKVQMATLVKRIHDKKMIEDPNVVKCVLDRKGFALYFSRSPIPYIRIDEENPEERSLCESYFQHIGMYSYTRDFLFTYTKLPTSTLESEEKLEQLRALEHGYKLKTIEIPYETVGVDTEQDLEKVRNIMKEEKTLREKGAK